VEVYVTEGGNAATARGGKKKRPRGEWVQVEVVRLFRGGSFEVGIGGKGAEEEGGEEEEEEEEVPRRKMKLTVEGYPKEWRHVAK